MPPALKFALRAQRCGMPRIATVRGDLHALDRSATAPREPAHDEQESALASCYAASAADVELLGARAGQRTTKLVRAMRAVPAASADRAHANVDGVDVHAEVAFDGRDRGASRPSVNRHHLARYWFVTTYS